MDGEKELAHVSSSSGRKFMQENIAIFSRTKHEPIALEGKVFFAGIVDEMC